jgi:YfiH family protein
VITIEPLSRMTAVRHGFFTRRDGVSRGIYASLNCGFGSDDDREAVAENRRRTMAWLGLPGDALTTCYQVHGTDVRVLVDAAERTDLKVKADAMVSTAPEVALGILTADCAPVLLADAEAGVVGAAHAGWRGARDGVLAATVAAMHGLGAEPGRMVAAVGPCIGPESYEVGPEFPQPFLDQDPMNQRFFKAAPRKGHYLFDLPGYAATRLVAAGVGTVLTAGRDTLAEADEFFSYRRACLHGESDYGRCLSAIALVD